MFNNNTNKIAEIAKRIIAGESVEESMNESRDTDLTHGFGVRIRNTMDEVIKDLNLAVKGYPKWKKYFSSLLKKMENLQFEYENTVEDLVGEPIQEAVNEATGDKEAYQKFFNKTLKKYGVKSPSELKGDDEKKFYDEIDAGWKGDDEKNESVELEEGKIDLKKKVKNEKEFESYMDSFKGPDILAAVEKLDSGEKHQKGTVGFFLSQQMSMKEGTVRLDARRREFREKIKKLAYAKAKKMIQDQDEEELEEGVFSNFIKHSIRKFIHKLSPEGRAAKAEKIAAAKEKLLNDYQRIKSAQERIKAASAALDSIKTVVKDKAHLASVEKELQSDFDDIDDELEEKNNN